MSFRYSAFGFRLEADRPLAGLRPLRDAGPADVRIAAAVARPESGSEDLWYDGGQTDADLPRAKIWKNDRSRRFRIVLSGGAEFLVDAAGSEVVLCGTPWPESGTLRIDLLGPVLAFVLAIRGVTPLHASAVKVGRSAALFVGPPLSGKSTIAMELARRGFPLLADDLVALRERSPGDGPSEWRAEPGFPVVQLRKDAVANADSAALSGLKVWAAADPAWIECEVPASHFCADPLPVGVVYLLERAGRTESPLAERVGPRDGLMALVANTWAGKALDREMRAREFESLGRFAAGREFRRMRLAGGAVRGLRTLTEEIERDFAAAAIA